MIHNIIFDYGGVIIDLDYNRTKMEFEKFGVKNFDEHFSQLRQTPLFDLLEKGKISEHDFRDEIRKQTGVPLTDEQIDSAWNSMLVGIREEKIHFLTHFFSDHKIYLLSNTNFIHLKAITKYLLRNHGRVNLDYLFDRVYYSCSMGMRKPEPETYRKVIEDNSLKPHETLYIDDSPQHIEGGRSVGLKVALYDPKDSLEEFVNKILQQEPNAV
ncbi:MAG TPA: HAD family phosphatase [Chitinophagales bacterium]|nr:HAD family phosphatase [Chitinophagales bacterium]